MKIQASVDRITAALPRWGDLRDALDPHPIERRHERDVHTAAWLAMRSWQDEVAPFYENLISTPGVAAPARIPGLSDWPWRTRAVRTRIHHYSYESAITQPDHGKALSKRPEQITSFHAPASCRVPRGGL